MTRRLIVAALLTMVAGRGPAAQPQGEAAADLTGTWMLVGLEQAAEGSAPSPVPNPRGLLVFDRAGHVLEIATRAGRVQTAINQLAGADVQRAFATYSGFWGRYTADFRRKLLIVRPEGAVNPGAMGRELTRSYDLTGDRLTVTAPADAPAPDQGSRWVWERVPTLENLSAAQRRLVGFWQHVVERRVNADTGAVVSETRRAPSLIVYTPSGFVGVHFPPLGRQPFAGPAPTEEEARAAVAGYVGYYGIYLVYPGIVYHHQLASLGGATTSFKRYFEISGSEINLKFPPVTAQGQSIRTIVTLRRLSGEREMIR